MAIDGNYNVAIDSPLGTMKVKLEMTTKGNILNGKSESSFGKGEFTGTVDGDNVSWDSSIDGPIGKMKLAFKGTIKGDDFSGEVNTGAFGTFPFKGKKA